MFGNEIKIEFSMDDGRTFEAVRGKIDADIGYEAHGMFVMKFKFDWGVYTYNSFLLDELISDVGETPRHRPQPYAQDLIKAMLEVCNVDYFGSIKDREVYILFGERNDPVGLVNVYDVQKSLIFDDICKATS